MRTVLHTLAVVALTASTANAFTAINLLQVNPLPAPGTFEVVNSNGEGPRGMWCAAASYAQAQLGAGAADRIYILQGYGPSRTAAGRKAIAFTITPDAALRGGPKPGDSGNYSVSMKTPGFNLMLAHARSFCQDIFDEEDFPF